MTKKSIATIPADDRPAILALTKMLLSTAMQRLASGQDVTQENVRIVNRARKAVAKAESSNH